TVRQALDLLERDGLIRRMQGVGTFVQQRRDWRKTGDILSIGLLSFEGIPFYLQDVYAQLCAQGLSAGVELTLLAADAQVAARVQQAGFDGLIALPSNFPPDLELLKAIDVPKLMLEIREIQPQLDHVLVD